MSRKGKFSRDPFTFSLRGLTTIASFVFPAAVADDRIKGRIKAEIDGEADGRGNERRDAWPGRAVNSRADLAGEACAPH